VAALATGGRRATSGAGESGLPERRRRRTPSGVGGGGRREGGGVAHTRRRKKVVGREWCERVHPITNLSPFAVSFCGCPFFFQL
jgi:hypothetical protein